MNNEISTDETVQFAIPGGDIFHLVLGKVIKSDNEFAHIQIATGSHDSINEFTNIKYPITHENFVSDIDDADIKIPLRYIVKNIDMDDEKIPFYEVRESPINFTACFYAPTKLFGTVMEIDFRRGGYWIARHSQETCSINRCKKGPVVNAYPKCHIIYISFGKNKVQVANLKDFNKKDPSKYSEMYLHGLESLIEPLNGFERRFVSAIKENGEKWFGFTSDNEYFDDQTRLELAGGDLDHLFEIEHYDSGYEDEETPRPKTQVIYARILHKGFPGKRSKVQWFDPADHPGLDKFITFIRSNGDHDIFKDRDPKQIITSMKNNGNNTIFADLVAGYFFKSAISKGVKFFREKFLWMF